tara:strand:+ start:350 stop:490 length:141 start_codon:yes stop_codon:yes gene_type:complete
LIEYQKIKLIYKFSSINSQIPRNGNGIILPIINKKIIPEKAVTLEK